VADVVAGCLQGQNGTVFAYGQTSTGKTHTMLGRETPASQPGQPPTYAVTGPPRGVVPRAVEALMQGAQAAEMTGWATQLTAMYIQQYGERLYDLLQPLPSAHQPWARDVAGVKALSGLELRPLPGGAGVSVAGARRVELTSVEVLSDLLAAGAAHRAFRATGMNASSSRSHAILQVAVRQTHRTTGAQRDAKLNLVDLAGSEKWSLEEIGQGVPPERVAELCAINASLSSLGACVRALGDPLRPHVPYRDSKLTRLLQDALGGAAQTVLLATLSPSLLSFEESASTVRFADAASRILVTQRHVVTAEDVDPVAQAAAARAEVARLQALLRSLTSGEEPSAASKLEAENIRLKKELADAKSKAAAAQRAALRAAQHVRPSAGDGVASPPLSSATAPPAASQGYASAPRQPASSGRGGKGTHIRVAAPPRRPGPASPPAPAQPAQPAAAIAGDTQRLSDGWTEPCDATPPHKPPPHRKPPPASPEWLAGYAAQKKAATEAAAAARAAAAEGTFDTRLRRKAGAQPAAWEQERFFSRPGGTATSPLQGAQRPRSGRAPARPGASSEQAQRRGSPVAAAERIPATHLLATPATPPEAATRQRWERCEGS
jgi:hypothetical protein